MTESVEISSEFHEVLEAHRRENETLEDTLRRLIGGPSPEALAELVGDEGDDLREAVRQKRAAGRNRRARLRERFE
jgi:hypothetical protein